MGTESVEVIKVTATVSRHNSREDTLHDALVEHLRDRLCEIVDDPMYRPITAMAH